MQQWIKTLTGLFVIQLVLVVLLNASLLKGSDNNANTPLLSPAPSTATKVVIQAQGEEAVTLLKQGDAWIMPDYFNLAVNPEKLSGFLEKLQALQSTWPEATTTAAQTRFEVAEDKYQRQISLFYGDDGNTDGPVLYLGTSPGYQRTHARLAKSDEIYSVKFSNYEASVGPQTWFDTNLLQLELGRINRIESQNSLLEQIEGQWRLSDLGPEETLDESAVKVFVTQLANLSLESALTDDAQSDAAKQPATATFKVFLTGSDTPVTFDFALAEAGNSYVLKSSLSPLYFSISKAQGDRLIETSREDLLQTPEAAENASAEAASVPSGAGEIMSPLGASTDMDALPDDLRQQVEAIMRQQQLEGMQTPTEN